MCLTIPARVTEVSGNSATIEGPGGERSTVESPLVSGLAPGDWVLHINRLVIRKISPDDAAEITGLLESGGSVDASRLDVDFREAVEDAHAGRLGRAGIVRLLNSSGDEKEALFKEADTVRRAWLRDFICIHGVIEFSNHCTKDCAYCGLRSGADIARYRMEPDEIIEAARAAVEEKGYKLLVLQSGEDPYYTDAMLAAIVRRIKAASRVFIFISAGERGFDSYKTLKEAGASGVLFRFETSNEALFKKLHPAGKDFRGRFGHLEFFRKLGFYIATGSLTGLPGQTAGDIADDILATQKWADMVSTGPFIPAPATPLAGCPPAGAEKHLLVSAILRLMMKSARIPVVTAFETLAGREGRGRALKSGANSLMINLTPAKYRGLYAIYPDKYHDDESVFVRYGLYKYDKSFSMLEERMKRELSGKEAE